jgi:hypothetical protein
MGNFTDITQPDYLQKPMPEKSFLILKFVTQCQEAPFNTRITACVAAGSLKRGEAQPLDQIRSRIHDQIPSNLAVSKRKMVRTPSFLGTWRSLFQ